MNAIRVVRPGMFGGACLAALLEATARTSSPVVGLPTGNTPGALYECLRGAAERGEADISGWRPFAIDEYGGPRGHPCSNRAYFARYWDTIPGAPPVEQFAPEAPDLEQECVRMSERLVEAGGLDVALLGIGLNGHLAFNEPGSARDSTVRRVELHEQSRLSARACWGDETPRWGLTLGLRELLAARSVIVMANGAEKAHIVGMALSSPPDPGLPASYATDGALWILDADAAAGLTLR